MEVYAESEEFIRHKGWGHQQFVNYSIDTLYLPEIRVTLFPDCYVSPSQADCKQVRSLMFTMPRFYIENTEPSLDKDTIHTWQYRGGWKSFNYTMIVDKFPNLQELFFYTNFKKVRPLKDEPDILEQQNSRESDSNW